MHFATYTISEDNKRLESWYCMNFKADFIDALKEFKRLPDLSFQAQLTEIEHSTKLEKQLKR